MARKRKGSSKTVFKDIEDRASRLRKKLKKSELKVSRCRERLEKLEHRLTSRDGPAGTSDAAGNPDRTAHLIFNPNAGGVEKLGIRVNQVAEALIALGFRPLVTVRTSRSSVRKAARAAVKDPNGVVVVAGGDGTVELAARELLKTRTPLGIIPLGTMNNLARSLNLPEEIADACSLLAAGTPRPVDAGVIRAGSAAKPKEQRFFLECAGVGISAIAAPAGQDTEKGRWAKAWRALQKLTKFTPAEIEVSCDDGDVIHASAQLVTVVNSPFTGAHLELAEGVTMDDGFLDAVVYAEMNKLDLVGHFVASAIKLDVKDPRITVRQIKKIHIESDRPLGAHADMQVLGTHRIWEVEVVAGALQIITGPPAHDLNANGAAADEAPLPEADAALKTDDKEG